MKTWLVLLGCIAAGLVLIWLLSAAMGLVFWAVVAGIIGALILAAVRTGLDERRLRRGPGPIGRYRSSRAAGRALKQLRREEGIEPARRARSDSETSGKGSRQ
jgi:hypothetical protein